MLLCRKDLKFTRLTTMTQFCIVYIMICAAKLKIWIAAWSTRDILWSKKNLHNLAECMICCSFSRVLIWTCGWIILLEPCLGMAWQIKAIKCVATSQPVPLSQAGGCLVMGLIEYKNCSRQDKRPSLGAYWWIPIITNMTFLRFWRIFGGHRISKHFHSW